MLSRLVITFLARSVFFFFFLICSEFCHTLKLNVLEFTCLPHPELNNEGSPGGSDGKGSAYNSGDPGSIPGWGLSPGEGNGNPLQYSCLENPMDGGAW